LQLPDEAVDEYASRLVEVLERYGVVLQKPAPTEPIEIVQADDGSLGFELIGSLPDGREPALSTLEVRERFRPVTADIFERDRYEYELIEHERDYRRAFHLHDPAWFEERYLVVVHEHCERPIATAPWDHYQAPPIRDGYAGVVALIDAWTGEPPDCSLLLCLD